MSELRIERISKVFSPGISALSDVSFDVGNREFVFLLGPSGAGKTTALRLIAGLDQPSSGQILIGGASAAGLSPRERDLAMVYDKHSMYPHLTVFENMAYPLRLRGVADDVMRKKIGDTADILDISALLDRRPRELSGGQQQMVAIGRALMANPKILLLDEVSLGLAPVIIRDIYSALPRIRENGPSVILVEQDIGQAVAVSDRLYCLQEGRISLEGPSATLDRADISAAYFGRKKEHA